MFQDAGKVISRISNKFLIKRKSKTFINYERSTKDMTKNSSYYQDYYLSEKWKNDLSKDAIAIINESIDRDLMAHFRYSILT